MPPDLAVLLVGIAARQATSPTARTESALDRIGAEAGGNRPRTGAFDAAMARLIVEWGPEWRGTQE